LDNLRQSGITVDTDYECKSLKGAMRRANDLSARSVLIIGEDELKKNVVTLKDMVKGEQKEMPLEELLEELKKCCAHIPAVN
jgi:histidyl-tRNA synthetase